MTFAGSGLVTQFSKCSTGSAIAVLASALLCPTAQAQLTPDATLGNEGSSVTEGAIIRGEFADLIEGGAERGSNLFHSFLEFNIDDGQRSTLQTQQRSKISSVASPETIPPISWARWE